ncbi:MAG TPA: protein kinase [Chthoniobacterales bacterium]|nr:protein kinase [Chthoniobacterales bacterium]
MAAPAENKTLLCEQCGAPLQSREGEDDCLHCLLTAGMASTAEEASALPDEPAARVYQHYEILTRPDGSPWELGRGAMGVTYKARDRNLDTFVALKIINARFSTHFEARQRFLREAQATARLRHPNVASVFHFGTINALPAPEGEALSAEENAEAGDSFYAMEFIEGETLEARLRRSGPLDPVTALQIAVQVTRALAAAERCGLVHRDLKPSNIMLAAEEERTGATEAHGEAWVKVIDFGLAKLERNETTRPAKFLGTLAFSSPEQLTARPVDARSDIYSLGITLWYSLTGNVPFPGSAEAQRDEPLPLAQLTGHRVPAPVVALLASMLARAPQDRPPSALALGELLHRCLEKLIPVHGSARRRLLGSRGVLAGALGMAGVAAVALSVYLFSAGSSPQDKSIAVLPFRNLTNNPANAFFAEGIEDDILSRLVKIRDLKVISHLSSSRFPASGRRDLSAIGQSLGVRHVLEGSFNRTGDRVVLHVSLIDTRDGHQLWSESYERTLADVITLQGELATAIANALNATLSPREKNDVRDQSTGNPDAYVLYLRGRKFDNSPTFAVSDNEAAQALYSQAIALDPGFALAHARRGAVLGFLYRFRGPSEELKENAYAEVEEALRLRPDLGEAHLARALCLYRIDRDYNRALPELETAHRLLPNDTEADSFIAYIHRRQGKWREAREGLERVFSHDPRNVTYPEELYTTGYLLRDWKSAGERIRQAEAIAPTTHLLKVERALVDLWQEGNLAPLQKVFADIRSYGDPEGTLAYMRWDIAMLARDFAAAEAAVDQFPFETLPSVYSAPVPKSYVRGCIALASGDTARARQFFEASRPVMEAEALAHPESELRHARLGLLYAYMGRKTDAIREGKRAVELKPVSIDAYDGPEELANLALIYAWVGEHDEAVSMIEKLLRMPGGVFFYEASMSWWELRLRWQWDPLRGDPRFQKILAAPEPPTSY